MNTLKALKRCALGLDLYMWLTYRTFTLKRPLRLSWRQLYRQFDGEPGRVKDNVTIQNFRRKVRREFKNSKWRGLALTTRRCVGRRHLAVAPTYPARRRGLRSFS